MSTGVSSDAAVGDTAYSDWLIVDQGMIDRFAEATLDQQYIHVDEERASRTPFGGTIAHGFLILSLLPRFHEEMSGVTPNGTSMSINYGLDRLRFLNPVRSGSRIRAASTLLSSEEKHLGRLQQSREVVIEIEGAAKPALITTWLVQYFIKTSSGDQDA